MKRLPIITTLIDTCTLISLVPIPIMPYNQPMIKQTKKFYNDAFTEIFSHIPFVKSLLQDFVHESWVHLIDFSHMEVTKSQFTGMSEDKITLYNYTWTSTTLKREADLLLKFSIKENTDIFIFILLEFQRTYKEMFYRLSDYLNRIYQTQYKNSDTLSVVVPIVIYNGSELWKEKLRFIDYFTVMDKTLTRFIPNFEYILIDINKFEDKLLKQLKSEVSYFFLLEKTDLDEKDKSIDRILEIFRELRKQDKNLFTLLARYITNLLYTTVLSLSAYTQNLEYRLTNLLQIGNIDNFLNCQYTL